MYEFLFLPEFSDPTHYFAVPFPLRIRCVLLLFLLIWMCFYFSMSSPFSGVGLSCVRNRIRRRKKTRRKPAPNQQTKIVLCMTDFVDVCFPSRLLVLLCVCFVTFFCFCSFDFVFFLSNYFVWFLIWFSFHLSRLWLCYFLYVSYCFMVVCMR